MSGEKRNHRDGEKCNHRDERERSPRRERHGFRDREERDSGRTTADLPKEEQLPRLPHDVPIPVGADGKPTGADPRPTILKPLGTMGRPITVAVNHFVIKTLPIVKIYQYDIQMIVPISSQRRGVEKLSAYQQAKVLLKAELLWGKEFVFDGVSLGWSTKLLVVDGEGTKIIDLEGHTAEKPNQVQIKIRKTGSLSIRALVNYLMSGARDGKSSDRMSPEVENCFKALNALYRQDPAARFWTRPNSAAFFVRTPKLTLKLQSTGGVLEAIRGMFQAVTFTFGHLALNVDVTCSAFYVPGLCMIDVARAFAGLPPNQPLNDVQVIKDACDRMAGMVFVVKHLNPSKNEQKMRVKMVTSKSAAESSFEEMDRITGQSQTISVEQYFKRKYNISLRYPRLPLLSCREGLFPMELCFTASGERYKEPLQGAETADFIKWATSPAFVRSAQIMENVQRLQWHALPTPKQMGFSVSTRMLEVMARILPTPIPQYGAGSDHKGPESGAWNLRGKRLMIPKGFQSWGLLYLVGGRERADDNRVHAFTRALRIEMKNLGMSCPGENPAFLKGNPHGSLKEEIKNLVGKTGNSFQRKPQLLMFLLHAGCSSDIYKTIKNICEVDMGIPSQCMIVEKSMNSRGQQQYAANVALKINLKMSGCNSLIKEPTFTRIRCMMIGGDTSHASPSELRKIPPPPSFSALVGSYDSQCCMYTAVATAQPSTIELMGNLKAMVHELLKRYKLKNRDQLPEAIIYWRDGIAESQITQFLDTEVKDLREAIKELGAAIKISVVNCVKRHHTRFFPLAGSPGDKLGNVLPGTIVEASPKQDIFLVSQTALQGTVRPTHYTMLVNEIELSPDEFQRITNGLCFAYGRATRSVSIVPPVYYADQVCERAKMHLRSNAQGDTVLHDVHDDLRYTMYWQ